MPAQCKKINISINNCKVHIIYCHQGAIITHMKCIRVIDQRKSDDGGGHCSVITDEIYERCQ